MDIVNYKDFLRMAKVNVRIPTKLELKGKQADGTTSEQQKTLRKFGIGFTGLIYKKQAMIVIDIAIQRAKKHLATPGQMRALEEDGIPDVHKRTFKEAIWILHGGDVDFDSADKDCPEDWYNEYPMMFITSYTYNDNKLWTVTAGSRKQAKEQYQILLANGARNFKFQIID